MPAKRMTADNRHNRGHGPLLQDKPPGNKKSTRHFGILS